MFEAHFGFRTTPFDRQLLPEQLYPSTSLRELRERLRYAIERAHIMTLTGEVGAGKSTALRATVASLPAALYRFIYLAPPPTSARSLYREILFTLHIDPPWTTPDARRVARDALTRLKREGQTPVLLVDEAHLLSPAMLEELRLLTNFEMDARSVFALVLCGLPELGRRLASQNHESLAQRIAVRYHLVGLGREETKAYVAHHLGLVGVERAIFADDALEHLFEFSHGVPRQVNGYALQALDLAWRQGKEHVDFKTMEMATAPVD